MECKNCGCPLPDDARFCRQCGQPVGGAVQAGTPAAGGDAPQAAGGTFTMAETPPQAPGLPGGALGTAQPEAALAVGGAQVRRKGAKLLAGIVAEGETRVHNIKHIDRGYEDYCGKLSQLGANVSRRQVGAAE